MTPEERDADIDTAFYRLADEIRKLKEWRLALVTVVVVHIVVIPFLDILIGALS